MPLTEDVPIRRPDRTRANAMERRRRGILDAAADAFAEAGYTATSLRDVATRAGLSHTGLMHHFPDKAGLLEAVLDDQLLQAAEHFPFETEDGEAFVRALVQATARDVQEPLRARMWILLGTEALASDHPAHGYFVRWNAEVLRRLTGALEDLATRGRYRGAVPPATAAAHVLMLRDGATLHWLLDPAAVDLVEVIRSQTLLYADIAL